MDSNGLAAATGPYWIGDAPHHDMQRGRPLLPARDPFYEPPPGYQRALPGTVLRAGRDTETVSAS